MSFDAGLDYHDSDCEVCETYAVQIEDAAAGGVTESVDDLQHQLAAHRERAHLD